MKTRICVIIVVVLAISAGFAIAAKDSADKSKKAESIKLESEMDKVSYIIGTLIGNQFKQQELEINFKAYVQGIKDTMNDKELAISQTEMEKIMGVFQQKMQKKMMEKMKKESEENLEKGEEFLSKNKKKEGVKTLPSGLQYKVIEKGTGETPKLTDKVKALYTGKFINGEVFDSTELRNNEPAVFAVNKVIPGWTEALQLMKVGGKWELYIPGKLAYGVRGKQPRIGPNETLIFEIELVDIVE